MKLNIKNIFRKIWLLKFLLTKIRDQWNLELTRDFIENRHEQIFKNTEGQLRDELAALNRVEVDLTEDQIKRKKELERIINSYGKIMEIYGGTTDELEIVKSYVNFIKKCLKF